MFKLFFKYLVIFTFVTLAISLFSTIGIETYGAANVLISAYLLVIVLLALCYWTMYFLTASKRFTEDTTEWIFKMSLVLTATGIGLYIGLLRQPGIGLISMPSVIAFLTICSCIYEVVKSGLLDSDSVEFTPGEPISREPLAVIIAVILTALFAPGTSQGIWLVNNLTNFILWSFGSPINKIVSYSVGLCTTSVCFIIPIINDDKPFLKKLAPWFAFLILLVGFANLALYIANFKMVVFPSMSVSGLWIPLLLNFFPMVISSIIMAYCILSTELGLSSFWKCISAIIVGIAVYVHIVNIT